MNRQRVLRRRIAYLVGIVVLLGLLSLMGRPATSGTERAKGSPGGVLAGLRTEYGLNQTRLGEIDPTSETIKLATFGMRGLAANILWEKAYEYKKKKDWTNLRAAVRQITKLEPNFVSVWIFQAWNQSHNISVEFEDVRQRYHWVINGVNFLKEGFRYNEREPRLLWEIGWVLSNKIGRADERKQFRYLFKKDDDFHGDRPLALRDNWLVAKEWFREAERIVDDYGVKMKGQGPLIYRSKAAMCQMSYAEALEIDGVFGEVARRQWKKAAEQWNEFGKVDIPAGGVKTGKIQLNEFETRRKSAEGLLEQLESLGEGLREQVHQEKLDSLTDEQREAYETPPADRSPEQRMLAIDVEQMLEIAPKEIARRITGANRKKAIELARLIEEDLRTAAAIQRSRDIVNFDYWRLRAQVEQDDCTLKARELIYEGNREFFETVPPDLVEAKQKYEAGLAAWREVLDKFPEFCTDSTAGMDLMEVIRTYREILGKCDEPFPEEFVLQDVIDLHGSER